MKQLKVATPSDLEILMTREFDAPPELVWEAMLRPELVRRWMFVPPGWTWAECEMDVRVGGAFRWAWNGPEGRVSLTIWGEYREVTPPRRIVHTEHMAMGPAAGRCDTAAQNAATGASAEWELLATLELAEEAGKTLLRMTLRFPSKAGRDAALASGMEQGMTAGYQALDGYLAARLAGKELSGA